MSSTTSGGGVTVSPGHRGGLTQQEVVVVSVAGGCGALLVVVLVVIIYTLVCSTPRRPQPRRYPSQVSVARSDFWPFSTVQSPPPTLLSPDSARHVFFKDDKQGQGQGQHPVLSRSFHKHGGPRRPSSLATLERGSQHLTSLYRPRSHPAPESGLVTSLYTPYYVQLLKEALLSGRDPFLWKTSKAHELPDTKYNI